jgi:hypothetical protein
MRGGNKEHDEASTEKNFVGHGHGTMVGPDINGSEGYCMDVVSEKPYARIQVMRITSDPYTPYEIKP